MRKRQIPSKTIWFVICGFAGTLAIGLLAYSASSGDDRFLGLAGALLPASLTVSAGIYAVQTWSDSRAMSNERQYREVIEGYLVDASNISVLNFDRDRELRVKLAAWGSPKILELMEQRSHYLHLVAQKLLPADQLNETKLELGWFTAELISQARTDVGMPYIAPEAVFNVVWPRIEDLEGSSARARVAKNRASRKTSTT